MAGKNKVVLTFAGDAAHLQRTVRKVESQLSKMGGKLTAAGKGLASFASAGGALNVIGGAAGALSQLSGAALLAPAALGAGAVALGGITIATMGFTDALTGSAKKQKEAYAAMGPEARKLVDTLKGLGPAASAFRKEVQDTAVKGLSADVKALAKVYLPTLQHGMKGTAVELNGMAHGLSGALQEAPALNGVTAIMQNTNRALRNGRTALGDFVGGFLRLGGIGSTYLPQLGKGVGDVARRFKAWTDDAGSSGRIKELIDRALAGFRDLKAIVKNVGATLKSVFLGLGGDSTSFLASLVETTKRIREFAESPEGQEAFRALGDVMRAAGTLLRETLIPALETLAPIVTTMAPYVSDIALKLAEWGPVIGPAVLGIYGLIQVLKLVGLGLQAYRFLTETTAIVTVAKWTWTAVTTVAKWTWMGLMAVAKALWIATVWTVQTLIAAGRVVLGWALAGIAVVAGWAWMALQALGRALAIAAVWIVQTAISTGALVLGWAVAGATVVAGWVWMGLQSLIQAGRMAAAWFIALGPIGWVIAAIIAIGLIIYANWDKIVAWTREKWGQFKEWIVRKGGEALDWVKGIPGKVSAAFSGFGSLLVNAGKSLITGLWNGIRGAYDWVVGKIKGLIQGIRDLFPFSPAKEGPFSGKGYTLHSGKALMTDWGKGMASVDLRPTVAGALGTTQSALSGAAPGGTSGGGPIQLVVGPGADGALVSVLHELQRRGQLQFARA